MDRSLKWRTAALLGILLLCASILAPTIVADDDTLPTWFPFKKKINLGLDLKGGLHIVYSIDLNTAIVDRASEIERDLKARFAEDPKAAELAKDGKTPTVRVPLNPIGAVTVTPPDPAKKAEIEAMLKSDYTDTIEDRPCDPEDSPLAICIKVSGTYAEQIKKSALTNAVSTIRERIDEKGVAEPSVVLKDDQIIVELPGLDKEATAETRDLIARTAKLEFKIVDDGSIPGQSGSNGSVFMGKLMERIGIKTKTDAALDGGELGDPKDADALAAGVYMGQDYWKPEDSGVPHYDYFLKAYDRTESIPEAEALKPGTGPKGNGPCLRKNDKEQRKLIVNGKLSCDLAGRYLIARYLDNLAKADPTFKVPEDHQIGYEWEEVDTERGGDKRSYWRTYYLVRRVELTGTAIVSAHGNFEQNTGRPIVQLTFNRFGARVFGDLTAQIVGQKLATILDDKVKSAPIINGAIRQGSCQITMGGGNDANRQIKERDELVNVLNTGSLPAPLREDTQAEVGPTLGRDAIDKTKLSFGLGIILVVLIMVGIYRWCGWISVFAVVFHIIMTLAVMAVFKATLTLPGIAAIVLSIGMEVDGNILIYERIRDELLLGKSVRGAVDLGFSRAFSAILDGQLTTAAAAWVLLQYGSGPIKGFAVLMLVGVFTTLSTNIWVTRIFFDWYIAKKKGQVQTISI
jgi:preprotein translocase subunit SecD